MKVVEIKDFKTGRKLSSFKAGKINNLFEDFRKALTDKQSKEDVLGVGYTCKVMDTGIKGYRKIGTVMTSAKEKDSMAHDPEPDTVKLLVNDKYVSTNLQIEVTVYPEGYVLALGKKGHDILGRSFDIYLKISEKRDIISMENLLHIFIQRSNLF